AAASAQSSAALPTENTVQNQRSAPPDIQPGLPTRKLPPGKALVSTSICGSINGEAATSPTTSAVPNVTATIPGEAMPQPIGLEKSSPVPTATGSPAKRPVSAAPRAESCPAILAASAIRGRLSAAT